MDVSLPSKARDVLQIALFGNVSFVLSGRSGRSSW